MAKHLVMLAKHKLNIMYASFMSAECAADSCVGQFEILNRRNGSCVCECVPGYERQGQECILSNVLNNVYSPIILHIAATTQILTSAL